MRGTLTYLAPELWQVFLSLLSFDARTTVTEKVDVWALGCVMYFCIAKDPPFCTDDKAFKDRILEGQVDLEGAWWCSISKGCKGLLMKMLTVDVDTRIYVDEVLKDSWLKTQLSLLHDCWQHYDDDTQIVGVPLERAVARSQLQNGASSDCTMCRMAPLSCRQV